MSPLLGSSLRGTGHVDSETEPHLLACWKQGSTIPPRISVLLSVQAGPLGVLCRECDNDMSQCL